MKDNKCSKTILIVGVIVFIILFLICCYLFIMPNNGNTVIESGKSNQFVSTNALTMMYETEANSGEYQVSSDVSWPQDGYVFNETLSKCENGSKLSWDDENKKVLLQANVSDKCYVYFDKSPVTLANYIINNVYTGVDGDNGLYYHDGQGDYINADQEAGDNSYRYSGANPNNYVCFGNDAETCSEDNLYRIIGIFDGQVKLIKNTGYDSAWGEAPAQEFVASVTENTLYSEFKVIPLVDWVPEPCQPLYWNNSQLDNYYIINYSEYLNYISDVDWHSRILSVEQKDIKEIFTLETINDILYWGKIGLMYISDYGYAALPYYWLESLSSISAERNSNNWLYNDSDEWTISIANCSPYYIVDGAVSFSNNNIDDVVYKSRPTFYLNSGVQYVSGTGTSADPYRISM